MKLLVESSLIIGWLRRVTGSSVVCTLLLALSRPVLRAERHWKRLISLPARHQHAAADARVVAVAEGFRILGAVEACLRMPVAAWRHLEADGFLGRALRQIRALEVWQRVRLLGWMLLVAVLTFRLVLGVDDLSASLLGLIVSGILLALALGLMWRSRTVAAAWVDRR